MGAPPTFYGIRNAWRIGWRERRLRSDRRSERGGWAGGDAADRIGSADDRQSLRHVFAR